MIEHVRRKTGLSHDKSQLAVVTVLSLLAERVPATETLVTAILEDNQQHVCRLISTRAVEAFNFLIALTRVMH